MSVGKRNFFHGILQKWSYTDVPKLLCLGETGWICKCFVMYLRTLLSVEATERKKLMIQLLKEPMSMTTKKATSWILQALESLCFQTVTVTLDGKENPSTSSY